MRSASQLLLDLINVIQVDVGVAKEMVETPRLAASNCCHHTQEESILCCVVRHPQECVTWPLVHIQVKHTRLVRKELVEAGARREQSLLFTFIHGVPETDDDSSIRRFVLDFVDSVHELVDAMTKNVWRSRSERSVDANLTEAAELIAISMAKLTPLFAEFIIIENSLLKGCFCALPGIRVIRFGLIFPHVVEELSEAIFLQPFFEGPFGPDVVVVFDKITDVSAAAEFPNQFFEDWFEAHAFRSQEGKSIDCPILILVKFAGVMVPR